MIRYIAVIDKDPDSDFGVYFPDLGPTQKLTP